MGVEDEVGQHAMVAADEQERRHKGSVDNGSGPSTSRGSQGISRNRQAKADTECWYCGKKGHKESECWKKCTHSNKSGLDFGRTEKGKKTMLALCRRVRRTENRK